MDGLMMDGTESIQAPCAKTHLRDYHGKMAAQYWSESEDVFHHASSQTAVADFVQRRRTQRYSTSSRLGSCPTPGATRTSSWTSV
uniref:Uncharacterized protein n=1 Tax=Knipowitschia caucasica TaxID=637954 RepID=A0AAV2L2T6_KNICA